MSSWVWTAFQKGEDKNANCLNCEQVLKRKDTSTKTMWSHLRSKHPDVFMKLKKTQAETPLQKISNSPTSKPKPKIVQNEKRKSPISCLTSIEDLKLPNVSVATPTNQPMAFPPQSNDDERQVQDINDDEEQVHDISDYDLTIEYEYDSHYSSILKDDTTDYNFSDNENFDVEPSSSNKAKLKKGRNILEIDLVDFLFNTSDFSSNSIEE